MLKKKEDSLCSGTDTMKKPKSELLSSAVTLSEKKELHALFERLRGHAG